MPINARTLLFTVMYNYVWRTLFCVVIKAIPLALSGCPLLKIWVNGKIPVIGFRTKN